MNFLLTLILAIFVLICKGATVPNSPSADSLSNFNVTFGSIIYGGSGCPQGSVSQNFNRNRTAFTFLFDSYDVTVGVKTLLMNRKTCMVNMAVQIPVGWQYSVKTKYVGFEKLDAGVIAEFLTFYSFSGVLQQIRNTTVHKAKLGGIRGNFVIGDVLPTTSTIWSPCRISTNLNLALHVAMYSPRFYGNVRVTGQTGELSWRKCSINK